MNPDSQPTPQYRDDEISLWEVLTVIVRQRRTIAIWPVIVATLVVGIGLILPRVYTSTATFRPQGSEAQQSQLMSLASQFGVQVPGMATEEASPNFYAELLRSRAILDLIASESFEIPEFGTVGLVELLEIEEDTPAQDLEEALRWLTEEAVGVGVSGETGTITISVVSEWPELSFQIVNRLLEEVHRFNLERRKSQAGAEREFIGARVDSARAALERAEDDLRRWAEANRQWESSPLLILEQQQLQREVSLSSTVLTTLVQSYYQAEVQEVRDTPVITVIQEPFFPPRPDRRGLAIKGLISLILGGLLGLGIAFFQEAASKPAESDPALRDFQSAWSAFMSSVPVLGRRYR